jgi:hypothetical protein
MIESFAKAREPLQAGDFPTAAETGLERWSLAEPLLLAPHTPHVFTSDKLVRGYSNGSPSSGTQRAAIRPNHPHTKQRCGAYPAELLSIGSMNTESLVAIVPAERSFELRPQDFKAKQLGLIAQTLLMAIGAHTLFTLMLIDLRFSALLERSHGRVFRG